jgi:hypothetical protein
MICSRSDPPCGVVIVQQITEPSRRSVNSSTREAALLNLAYLVGYESRVTPSNLVVVTCFRVLLSAQMPTLCNLVNQGLAGCPPLR